MTIFGLRPPAATSAFGLAPGCAELGRAAATPACAAATAVPIRKFLLFTFKLKLLAFLPYVGESCSEVVLHAQLDFAWIAWIVSCSADRSEGVRRCKVQAARLSEVRRIGQVEDLGAKFEMCLADCRELTEDWHVQP